MYPYHKGENTTDIVRILVRHPEDGNQMADEISGTLIILKMVVHKKLQWLVSILTKHLLAQILLRFPSAFASKEPAGH